MELRWDLFPQHDLWFVTSRSEEENKAERVVTGSSSGSDSCLPTLIRVADGSDGTEVETLRAAAARAATAPAFTAIQLHLSGSEREETTEEEEEEDLPWTFQVTLSLAEVQSIARRSAGHLQH